jgi:predicted ATPase/DNA-binding winged helix-turn-helix (wHTH) protein
VPTPAAAVLQFGPFALDVGAARLTRAGQAVALRPKAFDMLRMLAERPGQLVTKDELLDSVWGRRFVSESVIKAVVRELRVALAGGVEESATMQWIETVPRRGYRFAAVQFAQVKQVPPVAQSIGNIPPALLPLIGREVELAALAFALPTQRLITIAGPSGVGKTSLALAYAAAQGPIWREGVWFIELAPRAAECTDAAALCAALAQTLGLAAAAAKDASALAMTLRPLQLLLVLDNAEHLLAPLAPLVATLLAQAPGLSLLVTSQEPLHVAGEHVFRLSPLHVPDVNDDGDIGQLMQSAAMRLFVERATAQAPGLRLDADQHAAAARICRALDGLPLALELAAARVAVLGVQGIAGLLEGSSNQASNDERLHLLSHGPRNAVARQSSLRNALQWSHALLDDAQCRVFRRLGVFRGGFSLAAAQLVCTDDALDAWGVLDAVQGLVDKSLVVASDDGEGATRFMLMESPRSFALERLQQAEETDTTRQRHLQAMQALWQAANAAALVTPSLIWLARHRPDLDNLRAALIWAGRADHDAADAALELVVNTRMLWSRAGLDAEGRTHCEAVRAQAGLTANAALQRDFAMTVALLSMYGNVFPRDLAALSAQQLAAAYLHASDPVQAYSALHVTRQLRVWAGADAAERAALIAQMTALEQPHWSPLLARYGRHARAYEHRLNGDFEQYLRFCRDELVRMRQLGAVAEAWSAAQGLMLAESDAGHHAAALEAGRSALDEIRRAGQLRQYTALAAIWTTLLAVSGDAVGVRDSLHELLPALHSAATPWMAQVALAWLPANEDRVQEAAQLLGWCDASHAAVPTSRPGQTVSRALQTLREELKQRIDSATLAHWQAEGALLSHAQAEQLALAAAT